MCVQISIGGGTGAGDVFGLGILTNFAGDKQVYYRCVSFIGITHSTHSYEYRSAMITQAVLLSASSIITSDANICLVAVPLSVPLHCISGITYRSSIQVERDGRRSADSV